MAGQVKVIYTADETDAARGTANLIRLYKQMDTEAKNLRKTFRSTGRAGKQAMGDTSAAAKTTGEKTAGARGEMQLFSTAAKSAAANVKMWVTGLVGISGAVRAMKALVEQMREVRELQKQMFGVTVTSEEMALKTASLHGDVSPQNLRAVENQQIKLAAKYNITRELAASIQFTSISAWGTGPAGQASMESTAAFAGPQGLTADEVRNLPKFYKVIGADTKEKQLSALGGLYGGTKGSIVETGQMIDPLMTLLPPGMERGFTWQELQARHMGLIETLGPEKAAQAALILQEVTGGKTEKAQKYLSRLAKKKGQDWGGMTGPERLEFMREYYHSIQDDTRKQDELTVAMGGARGTRILRYAFSEPVEKQEAFTLKKIREGETSGVIEKMTADFAESDIAVSRRNALRKQTAEAETGRQKARATEFHDQVTEIHRQARANMSPDSRKWFLVRSVELEKRAISRAYAEAALTGVLPDSPFYDEAQTLRDTMPSVLTTESEWLTNLSRVTNRGRTARYGQIKLGEIAPTEPRGGAPVYGPVTDERHFGGGFEAFFQAQSRMQEGATEQTQAIKETLGVLKEIRDKLPDPNAVGTMGDGRWGQGNGDQ